MLTMVLVYSGREEGRVERGREKGRKEGEGDSKRREGRGTEKEEVQRPDFHNNVSLSPSLLTNKNHGDFVVKGPPQ